MAAHLVGEAVGGSGDIPAIEGPLAFLTDSEAARGAPFSGHERRTALSALVAAMAYSARCEHSDRLTAFGTRPQAPPSAPIPENGCLGILSRHAKM